MVPVIGAVSKKSEPKFRNYVQQVCYRVPKGNWARHTDSFFFLILLICFNFGRPGSSLRQALFLAVVSSYSVVVVYRLLTAGTSLVT